MKNTFTNRLKTIKRLLGIKTNKDLAKEFDVSITTLGMWLRGSSPGVNKVKYFLERHTEFNALWVITGMEKPLRYNHEDAIVINENEYFIIDETRIKEEFIKIWNKTRFLQQQIDDLKKESNEVQSPKSLPPPQKRLMTSSSKTLKPTDENKN